LYSNEFVIVYSCIRYAVSSDAVVTSDVEEYLRQLSFDNWQVDDAEMIILLRHMFIDLDLLNKCHIDVCIN